MHTENANYFLDHLEESFETYIGKTRRAFSGESMEIQFFLQDEIFTWKEQNILTRGEITVYPISNVLTISDTFKQLLEYCKERQKQIIVLQEENKCLNEGETKQNANVEKMINIKNSMENDFYSKFLLLLNTKKEKIRELQKALNDIGGKSKYDETTDESGSSDIESGKIHDTSHKSINMKKRKVNYKNEHSFTPKSRKKNLKKDEHSITPKSRKKNFKIFPDSSSDENPIASTSEDKLIFKETNRHDMIKFKNLDITEENSEEDIFAS